MNINRRKLILGAGCLATMQSVPLAGLAASSAAPSWPEKPVKLIVPNTPGGGIDIIARLLESELSKIWGQSVIVDYKPGAGTIIGTHYVAKSAPDGYTIGLVATPHVINPSLRKNIPFDTLNDLAGVTMTAWSNIVLCVAPSLPVNSLADLVAYGKAHKGKLSFATAGAGSAMHLGGVLLNTRTGMEAIHVPYKGSSGAYVDVGSGRVDMLIDPLFSALPHIRSGRLKPIAVLSTKRDISAPNIPAIGETLSDFEVRSISGVVVPKATSRELIKKMSADFAKALQAPSVVSRLRAVGLEPSPMAPEQFDAYIQKETKKWGDLVKSANISIE